MTLVNADMNRILEYLTKNDQEYGGLNGDSEKMDAHNQDGLAVSFQSNINDAICDKTAIKLSR